MVVVVYIRVVVVVVNTGLRVVVVVNTGLRVVVVVNTGLRVVVVVNTGLRVVVVTTAPWVVVVVVGLGTVVERRVVVVVSAEVRLVVVDVRFDVVEVCICVAEVVCELPDDERGIAVVTIPDAVVRTLAVLLPFLSEDFSVTVDTVFFLLDEASAVVCVFV